jgi:hypothetical protein
MGVKEHEVRAYKLDFWGNAGACNICVCVCVCVRERERERESERKKEREN